MILLDQGVRSEEQQRLHLTPGKKEAVKGIAMEQRERNRLEGVAQVNREISCKLVPQLALKLQKRFMSSTPRLDTQPRSVTAPPG